MKPTISAREHYDRLAEAGHGRDDPPFLQEFMARWDGPEFFRALGDTMDRDILEVGIGVGRIAGRLLAQGCRSLSGLDVSPKTIAAAKHDLKRFENLELLLEDITEFRRRESFDIACSVLTFMHVKDKRRALQNVVDSLRTGGRAVLSIDDGPDTLDFGKWTVRLYPWPPERYAEVLAETGCEVEEPVPLIDNWVGPDGKRSDTYGERVATLITAVKEQGL